MQIAMSKERAEHLTEERAEQARWRPRRREEWMARFADLVEYEFLPEEVQAERISARLRGLVEFAAAEVPYYRDLFARLKLRPADISGPGDLRLLPEMDKAVIRQQGGRLRPPALPAGESMAGSNRSSGSTGAPTVIDRTLKSRFLDILMEQRQLRWYRFDPRQTMAWIRTAVDMPRIPPGRILEIGKTLELPGWPHLEPYFETGPFFGFAAANPLPDQVAWLERVNPTYLRISSSNLEQLAFAFLDRPRLPTLRGLRAASEPLTPGMRRRIETTFGVPVNISLGLNEIGWIATRCSAGRYHAHAEHFLVEIVDAAGKPVPAGEFGRVLITNVGNLAMPLLRYVSDDVAQALAGPCDCGRSLPSFGDIIGRHSQMADLPDGTLALAAVARGAMEGLPRAFARCVREYQLRQDRAGDFDLRLVLAGPMPPGLSEHIAAIWQAASLKKGENRRPALSIRAVAEIPRAPSGKFFHFVSEFARAPETKDWAPGSPGPHGPGVDQPL